MSDEVKKPKSTMLDEHPQGGMTDDQFDQLNDDWIKRRYDVPGGPRGQALYILQGNKDKVKATAAFKHFLALPVSQYLSKATRQELHKLGFDYPEGHSEPLEEGPDAKV